MNNPHVGIILRNIRRCAFHYASSTVSCGYNIAPASLRVVKKGSNQDIAWSTYRPLEGRMPLLLLYHDQPFNLGGSGLRAPIPPLCLPPALRPSIPSPFSPPSHSFLKLKIQRISTRYISPLLYLVYLALEEPQSEPGMRVHLHIHEAEQLVET